MQCPINNNSTEEPKTGSKIQTILFHSRGLWQNRPINSLHGNYGREEERSGLLHCLEWLNQVEFPPAAWKHNPDKDSHHSSLLESNSAGWHFCGNGFCTRQSVDFFRVNPSEHRAFLYHTGGYVATSEPHFPNDCKVSHSTLCNSGSTLLVRKCCYFFYCSSMLLMFVLRQELLPQSVGRLKQV